VFLCVEYFKHIDWNELSRLTSKINRSTTKKVTKFCDLQNLHKIVDFRSLSGRHKERCTIAVISMTYA
jgi:hypothetical protein